MNHVEKPCQKCGAPKRRFDIPPLCDKCYEAHQLARFEAMPVVKWDGITPLVVHNSDIYFFDEDDAAEYVYQDPEARLCVCEPVPLSEVRDDMWYDELPEDTELPDKVVEALDALNKAIAEANKTPLSWAEGGERIDTRAEFPETWAEIDIEDKVEAVL